MRKRARRLAVPLLVVLAISVYLMGTGSRKGAPAESGHRVIEESIALPNEDLEEAFRAAADKNAPFYQYNKDKGQLELVANPRHTRDILSTEDGFDPHSMSDTAVYGEAELTGKSQQEDSLMPDDIQKVLRAVAAENDSPYVQEPHREAAAEDAHAREKRFEPAIAALAAHILSTWDKFNATKLEQTIKQLGSMKNMAPDIMAKSVEKEAAVSGAIEQSVVQQAINSVFGSVVKKEVGGAAPAKPPAGAPIKGAPGFADEIKAEISLSEDKGMIQDNLFAPPGMHMKVDIEKGGKKKPEADSSTQPSPFAFPLGMGAALMNGCFGKGYGPGDPCYNVKTVIPRCYDMLEGCTYVGVGFDGRGDYSSASRKKNLVQRYCKNKRKYHGGDVPDTMNVQGIYDTKVSSYVFESRQAYRRSLQAKAGASFSGYGFQAAVEAAYGSKSSSQKQMIMSLIECNVVRYEIFLDDVRPDTLSLDFLRDFLDLPESYKTGKSKLQEFLIRYGTHYIKSAKFGGSFRLFKTQEASKTTSLTEFAVSAQASYSRMFSAGASASVKMGSEQAESEKTSSTRVTAEGGDQEVAAIVADFYTTGFKDTFSQWLKTIPTYPKPVDMFMGTLTELLNLNYKLLFPFDIKDVAKGCFSEDLKTENGTGKNYYEIANLVNNTEGVAQTVMEKRYCEFTAAEKFQEAMDRKRLALERAITVYMEEGPVPANDFHLEAGPAGCQSDALVIKGGKAGVAHPPWQELINGNKYKIIFDLPQDINENIQKDAAVFVIFGNGRWNCHLPGTRVHAYNSHLNGGSGDTKNKLVSCFGFVMTYNEETGQFSVTSQNQDASKEVLGTLPGNYANTIVGRAEYINPLEHSRDNQEDLTTIVQVPCTAKWSNSYQIDPAVEDGQCLYFVAASAGDIFVMFAAIPRDTTTWFHLQIGVQGVALYKGMKLVKYEGAKHARALGAAQLFQPYFICLDEENSKTYIKYGIGSDTSEKGMVYMVYTDLNPPLGIRFYSFGGGEANVEVMDARVIAGSGTGPMKCTGGTIMKHGQCVEDCHPECDGCMPMTPGSKLDTECRRCKHFTVHVGDGRVKCVPEGGCPPALTVDAGKKTCTCPVNNKIGPDGTTCICKLMDVNPENPGKYMCVSKCPDLKKPNDDSPTPKCVCKISDGGICVEKCPLDAVLNGGRCSENCQVGDGRSFRGTVAVSATGRTCQRWISQEPHAHSYTPVKYPKHGLEQNYCRNPSNNPSGLWCYTRDPNHRYDLCAVPSCPCRVGNGKSYRGTLAVTASGKPCVHWDSHNHRYTPTSNPKDGLKENYCRNPTNHGTVWCYVTKSKIPNQPYWEECALPYCPKDCQDGTGKTYRGRIAVTGTGKTCQRWDSQKPHGHKYNPATYQDSGLENNYCRNPSSGDSPWCYTTDPKTEWEYCTIPDC